METEKLILTDKHSGRVYRTKQKKNDCTTNSYLWLYKSAIGKKDSGAGSNVTDFQRD